MAIKRRTFMGLVAASSVAPRLFAAGTDRLAPVPNAPEIGKRLPAWKAGELELHFIHTGRGENMFYVFPDGTTMVNDTGDYYRPKEIPEMPWLPRADLLGGECVARYIGTVWKKTHLDYMALSHWHADHTGRPSLGSRLTPDRRQVCGLALLGEAFTFGRFYDHQFPRHGQYGSQDGDGMEMMESFVAAKKIPQEPFRPGALNQIRLLHDAEGQYRDSFSIRNVCANAVCWTGQGEDAFDHGAAHAKATGQASIPNQNTLSMGFVVQYGKFRYWTGGDLSADLAGADGIPYNYEALVGKRVGPVTVCKTNHHACKDAMTRAFVGSVRAAAYVTAVWCPRHIQDCNMRDMGSRELYPGARMVFPTYVPEWPKKEWPAAAWWRDVAPGGHVVVKVAPGGGRYTVFLVDASDESLRVKSVWSGIA